MIVIEHLEKAFQNGYKILKDINVVINKGEIISIIGPSGTGKSTLLRCLNMLSPPTAGKIFLDGEEITKSKYPLTKVRKKIGMVFQSFNLFEHLTAIENIVLPQVLLLGLSKQEAYNRGMVLLEQVGMKDKYLSLPQSMSGGQKQRVAIARTLAMNPEIILFDEPTSALDPSLVDEVKAVIRQIGKQGVTMLIVTHDMNFVKEISTRIFFMDQGIIYEEGTPDEIFNHPKKERTRRFIKRLKVLEKDFNENSQNLIEMFSLISSFGMHNQINYKFIQKIYSITEELVFQQIIPKMKEKYSVHYIMEYQDTPAQVTLSISYDGEKMNPLEQISENEDQFSKDTISKKLIQAQIFSSYYNYSGNDRLANTIKIELKE